MMLPDEIFASILDGIFPNSQEAELTISKNERIEAFFQHRKVTDNPQFRKD